MRSDMMHTSIDYSLERKYDKCAPVVMGMGAALEMPKLTQTEAVRVRLEHEVLTGVHPPGVHLDEIGLAHWMGCSRTPLREALNQLVATGLLVRHNHRGVFVAPFDRRAVLEQMEAYAELEAACAGLAAQRMPTASRADLGRLVKDCEALRVMVRAGCGNRSLAELASSLARRVEPFRRLEGEEAAERDQRAAQALARAIAKGDGDAAAKVVRDRLMTMGRLAVRHYPPLP